MQALGMETRYFPENLEKVRTLDDYGGNRLCEMRSASGQPWLKMWFDEDLEQGIIRWLVVRMTPNDLAQFLANRDSLRDVILKAHDGFVFLFDEKADKLVRAAFVQVQDIPEKDLPQ